LSKAKWKRILNAISQTPMKRWILGLLIFSLCVPTALAENVKPALHYLELHGAADNSKQFRELEDLTRAAMYKILFRIFGESGETPESTHFEDVPVEAWFAPYAELAWEHDFAKGKEFNGDKNVRRIDALSTLLDAYGLGGSILTRHEKSQLFADVPGSHRHYNTLKRAVDSGIFFPDTQTPFRPYDTITRGEFAQWIYEFDQWQTVQLSSDEDLFYKSDILADVVNRIQQQMYLQAGLEIDPDALIQAAIKGIMQSLDDPFSSYFTPEENQIFFSNLDGELQGIGAYLLQDEITGEVFISEIVEDSPAADALEIGDQILSVDGTEVTGLPISNVVNRVRGASGTPVELRVKRDGRTLQLNITRADIQTKSVKASLIDGDTWVLDIDTFGSNTRTEITEAFEELESQVRRPQAVVLDLRGNVGGYVTAATHLAGHFMDEGETLMIFDYGDYQDSIENFEDGPYQNLPLYIFVDRFSASASEIVAASLQDRADAIIIGTQSYGKGTAQQITSYWDGSSLKLTIAEWLSSAGRSIQGVGVTPDLPVSDASDPNSWLEELNNQLR
jgi:carboxyl-terminal processing protease